MAEINVASHGDKQKRKTKKLSTRVDLTPMVDLGFLLITFFIFTTSMYEPKALKLNMPPDTIKTDSMTTIESKILNVVLGDKNTVFYYRGVSLSTISGTTFPEIRKIIQDTRTAVRMKFGDPKELVILIKPTATASYENVVGMLDEMIINDVTRYMLVEPAPQEILKIKNNQQ